MPGQTYTVNVEVGNYDQYLNLWIDWNDNQIFESNEHLVEDFVCDNNTTSSTDFVVPETANIGSHRLRARVSFNVGADPCEEVSWGEAEDYTVELKDFITWTGAISTDWFEVLNYDVGIVPTSEFDVFIPETPNQPFIGVGLIGAAKNITIDTGAIMTIDGELNTE
jgi:hypothetical protein